jgi:Protein of unknown function (DUF1064)
MKPSERAAWEKRVAELATYQRPASAGAAAKKNRLQNAARATYVDGIRFASRLEADRYRELKLLQLAGDVVLFLRQVPFDVATGVVYRLDFLVVWNPYSNAMANVKTDEVRLTFEDTKGRLTEVSRIKIRSVEDRYGITIKLLTREDVRR